MNERMIELYREASEFAYKICREEGRTGGHSDHIWNTLSTGKFAELIVRECINIAYEHDGPKLSGPGLRIAMSIESHFDIYIEEDGRFVK